MDVAARDNGKLHNCHAAALMIKMKCGNEHTLAARGERPNVWRLLNMTNCLLPVAQDHQ
jgi:hypothetical protein